MKALVTGGCGFIGHNLVKALLDNEWEKWEVLVMDDLSSGKKWNRWDGVEYIEVALEARQVGTFAGKKLAQGETAIDTFVANWNPDVIFHLAAVPRVSYSVENPYETTERNVLSTLAVLDAARKHGKPNIRVVNTSSSSIYGGADELPTPPDAPANPQSPYAMQKWQGEEWCKMYAKLYGLDVVCLRYFNVFGPHSYFGGAYSTVLSAWMYHLYVDASSKPFLEGDGEQTRDFCHVDNVTHANILAAVYNKGYFEGEAFNIAQGSSHSLLDCKALLEKISGKDLVLEQRPPRVGDVKHTLADIRSAAGVLEYVPSTDFERQVRTMTDWYEKSYKQD